MTNDGTAPRLTPELVASLLLDSTPYLSCDDCFDQLDTYVEAVIADPGHTDRALEVHLAACGACAQEVTTLLELVTDEPHEN